MDKMVLVYITCKNNSQAKKIALHLLKKRFIECANIIPKIESLYWWNKKIKKSFEALLLCKTFKAKISAVKKEVKKLHSYKVPCIEFFEVFDQNKEYLDWLKKELK